MRDFRWLKGRAEVGSASTNCIVSYPLSSNRPLGLGLTGRICREKERRSTLLSKVWEKQACIGECVMQFYEHIRQILGLGVEPKNLSFIQISLRGIIVFVSAGDAEGSQQTLFIEDDGV